MRLRACGRSACLLVSLSRSLPLSTRKRACGVFRMLLIPHLHRTTSSESGIKRPVALPLVVTGARRNPATCVTNQLARKRRYGPALRAGGSESDCGTWWQLLHPGDALPPLRLLAQQARQNPSKKQQVVLKDFNLKAKARIWL